MEAAIIVATGLICIICFIVGASVGQSVAKGEEVKLPAINPIEVYRANQAKKEAQMEQDRVDTIMRNMECYDGTANGQEDVPVR